MQFDSEKNKSNMIGTLMVNVAEYADKNNPTRRYLVKDSRMNSTVKVIKSSWHFVYCIKCDCVVDTGDETDWRIARLQSVRWLLWCLRSAESDYFVKSPSKE
jgi:RNase P subunit RPR2